MSANASWPLRVAAIGVFLFALGAFGGAIHGGAGSAFIVRWAVAALALLICWIAAEWLWRRR